jgi:hypothetical protein
VLFTFLFHGYLVSWLYFMAFALVLVGLVLYYSETPPIRLGKGNSLDVLGVIEGEGTTAESSPLSSNSRKSHSSTASSRTNGAASSGSGKVSGNGKKCRSSSLIQVDEENAGSGVQKNNQKTGTYSAPAYNPLITSNPDTELYFNDGGSGDGDGESYDGEYKHSRR